MSKKMVQNKSEKKKKQKAIKNQIKKRKYNKTLRKNEKWVEK
jgi:hypothetical protein